MFLLYEVNSHLEFQVLFFLLNFRFFSFCEVDSIDIK